MLIRSSLRSLVYVSAVALFVAGCGTGASAEMEEAVQQTLVEAYGRMGMRVDRVHVERVAVVDRNSFGEPTEWCLRVSFRVSGTLNGKTHTNAPTSEDMKVRGGGGRFVIPRDLLSRMC